MASEATSKRSVAVGILGRDYRIRTEADEATVGRVADLVNATMERIRVRTGTVDTLDLAVLAALNLANDLVVLRGGMAFAGRERDNLARLRTLIDEVEAAVRDDGLASQAS